MLRNHPSKNDKYYTVLNEYVVYFSICRINTHPGSISFTMPPKKNPFVCYAMMRKKQLEEAGVELAEGFKTVVELVGHEWEVSKF